MGAQMSRYVFQPPEPMRQRRTVDPVLVKTERGEEIACVHIGLGHEYTVLFSHGNAEDIGMLYTWFDRFFCQVLQVNGFVYDYAGYGASSGSPSEQNVYADAEAAYKYLRSVLKIPADRIILFGRSLGTAPTVHLAALYAYEPIRGIMLQSPFLSIYRIGFNFRFSLPGDMFSTISLASRITCPVFLIHGTLDDVIPFWHATELYRILSTSVKPLFIRGGRHNNLETQYEPLLLAAQHDFIHDLCVYPPPEHSM